MRKDQKLTTGGGIQISTFMTMNPSPEYSSLTGSGMCLPPSFLLTVARGVFQLISMEFGLGASWLQYTWKSSC